MDSTDFFSSDMALHEEQDQLKRQKSALKLNVQSIDPAAQEGVINDYHVSLIYCPCREPPDRLMAVFFLVYPPPLSL